MSHAFVWFHNGSRKPAEARRFYEGLLGWAGSDGPEGLTMFAGETGPFAGLGAPEADIVGWLPYAEVADLDAATRKAQELGAEVLQPRKRGPAGEFTIVRDPGGAALALWQKA